MSGADSHTYDFIRPMGLDPFSSASVSTPLDPGGGGGGRALVTEVGLKRWHLDVASTQAAILMLSSSTHTHTHKHTHKHTHTQRSLYTGCHSHARTNV
jgi:hypothetical protein